MAEKTLNKDGTPDKLMPPRIRKPITGKIPPSPLHKTISPQAKAKQERIDKYNSRVIVGDLVDFIGGAWLLMLALGALHHTYNKVPHISFTTGLLTQLAIWAVLPSGVLGLKGIKYIIETEKGYK